MNAHLVERARELRLMVEKKFLTPAQLQRILGVEDPRIIPTEERPAPLAIAEKGFAQLHLIAEGGQA